MKLFRIILLITILCLGTGLVILFVLEKVTTPLTSTLAPFFQVIGITAKSLDRVFARVIPVDELDEAELGNAFSSYYTFTDKPGDPEQAYLESLLKTLLPFTRKPFVYRVYVLDDNSPNAFALPGGIILVTKELLRILETDGEAAAILAHEIGHIELSHCFDAVKFQLFSRKLGDESLGWVLDFTFNLLLGHSFSKTEENEADDYAYALLLETNFDPGAMGRAFGQMLDYETNNNYTTGDEEYADLVRDYFMSHPPLAVRREKFEQKALVWWKLHPHGLRDK